MPRQINPVLRGQVTAALKQLCPAHEISGTEDLQGNGKNGKGTYESRYATVAKHAAGDRNGDESPLGPHNFNDSFGDRFGRAGDIHRLCHQSTCEEDQIIILKKGGKAGHEVDFISFIDIHLACDSDNQRTDEHRQINIEAFHDHVHQ